MTSSSLRTLLAAAWLFVAASCGQEDPRPALDAGVPDATGPTGRLQTSLHPPDARPLLPPPDACFVDDATAAPRNVLPGRYELGGFSIALDPAGVLEVTHRDTADRSLYTSPAGGFLGVARGSLDLEEHQGSFFARETILEACAGSRVDEVRWDGRTLVLSGGFDGPAAGFDGPAAGCDTARFELQLCELADGHLGFRASTPGFNRLTWRAASDAQEAIFGVGEQFPHERLNLKGRALPVLSQEGGVGRGHAVISPAVNAASPGSAGSEDSTYYAAPHYLTSRLRSIFLENTEYAVFDFRGDDVIELRLHASRMDGRILQGMDPLHLIERFTAYAGRMPPLPSWAGAGAVVALAKDTQSSLQIVDTLLDDGVPIAAVWNQTWSGRVVTYIGEQVLWNWVPNPTYHPGWDAFADALETRGIRLLCYVNPMFVPIPEDARPVSRDLYAEGLAAGHFVRDASGEVLHLPATAFEAALLDLSSEPARRWFKDILITEVMGNGHCDGWMVDFGEALPFDARLASGEDAAAWHNRYPVEWMRLNREALEEAGRLGDVLLFNRSGHTRTPAHSLLLWEGDQLTTWDRYDGLLSAIHGLISGGFSGISLNHSDIGGYTSVSRYGLGYSREAEQLMRWVELSAFTALFRTHEGNQPAENAQVYSDDTIITHFARFSRVYAALAFYRDRLFVESSMNGWPLVRHLWLHYPDDPRALAADDEFLLGDELLVAPVHNKCWTWPYCPYDKEVYLPAGEWVHLWTGVVHGIWSAGTDTVVAAPIGQPAVFYRRGSEVGARLVDNLRAAGLEVADPPP